MGLLLCMCDSGSSFLCASVYEIVQKCVGPSENTHEPSSMLKSVNTTCHYSSSILVGEKDETDEKIALQCLRTLNSFRKSN